MRVGVIAIQGDFEKHSEALRQTGVNGLEIREIRTPEELAKVDRAILPGGESTTVGLLMERYGMGDALKRAGKEGMPLWGTCMGMIMLATDIEDRQQYTLGLLDITVRRNAFGAQIHSFEDEVEVRGLDEPVTGVFIRAPVVTRVGPSADVLCEYRRQVVGVRQGKIIGTSFHPELTDDFRLHRWFLTL
ncbi:MAG: pyridoxal 5'-phosphate synthase glutaminase subunit PdxT [Armatimonadetes bacterium]|nr:pyridoxal 5'-phosphate synthase glutaminase subunit PdxT [Armatimonadota bacterium]MBS1703366.1 pyridoxal 5'-phosphate synthase glutaminase subunit PdxT [Armatimonadota bacterium]MBS1727449.1 pyridoxal 5'-phosphate synthase glutaminase subunit PdxT [Armatimonadota bacterium]